MIGTLISASLALLVVAILNLAPAIVVGRHYRSWRRGVATALATYFGPVVMTAIALVVLELWLHPRGEDGEGFGFTIMLISAPLGWLGGLLGALLFFRATDGSRSGNSEFARSREHDDQLLAARASGERTLETFNFETYTMAELQDVARHIDRERYADRAAEIDAEIERRAHLAKVRGGA